MGIYRDLAGTTVDDYWCSQTELLLLEGADRDWPPPVVLAGRRRSPPSSTPPPPTRSGSGPGQHPARRAARVEAPLRDDLSLADTDEAVRAMACRDGFDGELAWCAGGRPALPGTVSAAPIGGVSGSGSGSRPGPAGSGRTAAVPMPMPPPRTTPATCRPRMPAS